MDVDGQIGQTLRSRKAPRRIEVRLPSNLAAFILPEPPSGGELVEAIRASLRILELPTRLISYPLYAFTWVGPLGIGDFTVHLDGGTGKMKTVRAALIQ